MSETHDRVWVLDDRWRVVPEEDRDRLCRWTMAGHKRCPNAGVVELNRGAWTGHGRVDRWWAYCEEHTYGHRIVGDHVYMQVHPDSPSAKRAEERGEIAP